MKNVALYPSRLFGESQTFDESVMDEPTTGADCRIPNFVTCLAAMKLW